MRKIRSQAALVANVDIPVLLLGESGTGKEVLGRLIHKLSPRAHRTFLKVNCAAVPADLLESELFGYEPGAFTGATHAKPGKFELCNKGTILLDEIGEMPPLLQAKLLHVLQDQQFSQARFSWKGTFLDVCAIAWRLRWRPTKAAGEVDQFLAEVRLVSHDGSALTFTISTIARRFSICSAWRRVSTPWWWASRRFWVS